MFWENAFLVRNVSKITRKGDQKRILFFAVWNSNFEFASSTMSKKGTGLKASKFQTQTLKKTESKIFLKNCRKRFLILKSRASLNESQKLEFSELNSGAPFGYHDLMFKLFANTWQRECPKIRSVNLMQTFGYNFQTLRIELHDIGDERMSVEQRPLRFAMMCCRII